jgi:hypothetical protein
MGAYPKKTCSTNSAASAPNPFRYKVLLTEYFDNATLLVVEYPDCENYEGKKILVYGGRFEPNGCLDPHFSREGRSPIARFKPEHHILELARLFCEGI